MSDTAVLDTLRRTQILERLPDDRLGWIRDRGEEIRLDTGATVATQGDPPDGFYVVLEGAIEWTRRVKGEDVFVVTLAQGSTFAELILVLDTLYPATGRAVTPVRLFKLDAPSFQEMLRMCPGALCAILAQSIERAGPRESVSEQHAKLISLGTMAAGLAHELNNPAAAIGRSAAEAREVFHESSSKAMRLGALQMGTEERAFVAKLPEEVAKRAEDAPALDSIERGDREDEVAVWLEERGIEEAWVLSPTLVAAGLDVGWLEDLEERLPVEGALGEVLAWLASGITGEELLGEIQTSSGRISELVKAVKSYSHMDRTSMKEADVHEGLENTLVMLGHKLKKGNIRVVREYAKDVPPVCAYGSQLDQVWTNLIDNAIDAVEGDGTIRIRTTRDADRVLVEVADDGPGIPSELQARIFEPFFTTKGVGQGTGLGLDISHRVVVDELGGEIVLSSRPGDTRFAVRLPVSPAAGGSS